MKELLGDILEAHGGLSMPQPLLHRKPEAGGTEETLRTVNEFLAIVSHELRTPVTAILGWTQLLGRGKADPDRVALALEVIERNARLQARLVEEMSEAEIDRNLQETFPASDPPSWTLGTDHHREPPTPAEEPPAQEESKLPPSTT